MSYAGVIRKRGSRATQKRSTESKDSVGQTSRAWTTLTNKLPVLIQELTNMKAQEMFGQETKATLRGDVEVGTDIELQDGLVVTKGHFADSNFRVVEVRKPNEDVIRLGLELTAETFA
jgi:hypothetical protein